MAYALHSIELTKLIFFKIVIIQFIETRKPNKLPSHLPTTATNSHEFTSMPDDAGKSYYSTHTFTNVWCCFPKSQKMKINFYEKKKRNSEPPPKKIECQ